MFAILEITDFRDFVALVLRVGLTGAGVFVGWLLTKPLVRLIYRAAFQRPVPPTLLTLTRLVGAAGLGVLCWFLFPLGFGGGGGGTGPGTGPGTSADSGKDGGGGKDSAGDKGGKKEGGDKAPALTEPARVVHIELVLSKHYKRDSERYYLMEGREPPQTLEEVKKYLHKVEKQGQAEDKGDPKKKERHLEMEVIRYANSVDPTHPAVKALLDLAESREFPELRAYQPKAFWSKTKPE